MSKALEGFLASMLAFLILSGPSLAQNANKQESGKIVGGKITEIKAGALAKAEPLSKAGTLKKTLTLTKKEATHAGEATGPGHSNLQKKPIKGASAKNPAFKGQEDANGIEKASSKNQTVKTEAAGPKSPVPAPHAHKLVKSGKGKALFVPPPPPSIPTYLEATPYSGVDIGQVELLSLDDLKYKQQTLQRKLEGARQDQKDQEENLADLKQKSSRFDALYAEGVVSRKELEDSKRDTAKAERELEQSKLTLADYERLLSRVKERIGSLESAKTPGMKKQNKKAPHKKD